MSGSLLSGARYGRRFVDALPGDWSEARGSRQVLGACYSAARPTPVRAPRLLAWVPEVAGLLGLEEGPREELAQVLGGNRVVEGMVPYAACYGGHQFGNWAGQLGDGRAITLGEIINPQGEVWELQLKGAGPTPYSRRADGRAVLRSSVRELVASEAMFHLGVPSTRALSLVETGEGVVRDMFYDGHPQEEPGAIVCRVAPSFLRFGNFEIHAARQDVALLKKLAAFTVQSYFPAYAQPDGAVDVLGWFGEVARRTAHLMGEWTRVGFVHGVMNTDNLSILGLTIDYGPYGWLDAFDPGWTPNTTDAGMRRYRFGNQPWAGRFGLAALASALLPLVDDEQGLEAQLHSAEPLFAQAQREAWARKLGLTLVGGDGALFNELMERLEAVETDMTLFFRRLAQLDVEALARGELGALREGLAPALYQPMPDEAAEAWRAWMGRYAQRLAAEGVGHEARRARMDAANPAYVPRNYLLVEAIERCEEGDLGMLHELMEVLRRPYEEQDGKERYALKRPDWARHKAGCSMLSCSS